MSNLIRTDDTTHAVLCSNDDTSRAGAPITCLVSERLNPDLHWVHFLFSGRCKQRIRGSVLCRETAEADTLRTALHEK